MTNNKSQKILENGYSADLSEVVDYIVLYNQQREALNLYRVLDRAINENKEALTAQPKLLAFYQEALIKLKFICLANLDNKEILSLIKNSFCLQLNLPDYDLLNKLNAALVNIILVDERNKLKDDLRRVILVNNEKIVINHSIKLIKDWLKNYVSVAGVEGSNELAKIQYLISLKNDKLISPVEYKNLQILFKFYDYLNKRSDSPAGMEEEYPVVVGGKLYIFRKGVLEPVSDRDGVEEALNIFEDNQIINGQEEDKNKIQVAPSVAMPVASPSTPYADMLADLEQALKNYPSDSLEHKAIKQEINRLKVAAFKQAQKTNVKK